ncbi:MAG: ABC-2 transporter permease [Sphaerochaetaceae bacterium]
MIGLIKKELMLLTIGGKSILLVLVVFLAIFLSSGSGEILSMVAVIMSLMLSLTLFAYDTQSKWDCYATVLPVGPKELVGARYIVVGMIWTASIIIALIFRIGLTLLPNATVGTDFAQIVMESLLPALAIAVVLAIALPLMYKFGVEKGRIFLFIVCIIPSIFIQTFLPRMGSMPEISLNTLMIILAVAAALAVPISLWLSVRIYGNKDQFA